ncbi:epithelial sodium channel subunit alpha-like [Glandiceps talaboti]
MPTVRTASAEGTNCECRMHVPPALAVQSVRGYKCGQDEIECVDPRPDKINENHSHWCVRSDRVCDGVQDCQHPNDEEQCSVAVGPPMKIPGKCLMTQNRTNFILQVTENVTESWCESSYAMSSCFRCLSSHYNILTSECTTFRESHLLEDNELLEDSNCTYYYRNTSTHCNGYGCDDLTKCISKAKVCDFHEDCIDGSDEEGCTRPCFGDEFTCDNGQCLHKHKACDKIADCLDGSDEIDCPDECADTHFLCNDNQGERCILMYKKCDVIQDCTHPNDEDPTMCTMMIEQAMEETELFGDGWNDRFLSSVSNLSHFDTFKEIYSDLGFQRVMYEDPPDWKRFIAFSSTADNSDLKKVLKFGKDEANILGHQKEDMILDCKYGGKQCYPSDFLKTQNDVYGNCFTFNHGVNASLRNASKTGPAHGLELTLSTEQSEYTAIYGQESGIRVAVHPQGITLLPEDRGVSVPPGMKTSIGVRKRIISRQSEPYGHCLETKNENNWRVNDSSSYTELACRKLCVQTHVYNICGCVDSYILNIPIKPKCSVLNETQQMCTQFIHFLYQVGELPCDCPKHCLDVKFETKLSLAAWPSDVAARTLTHLFRQNKEKWKILSDNEAIRRNLLKVVVYYYDLNANLIAEVPAYQFFSLFSDLGGSLGLFVGVSLVTIVEFFEYVWDIFRLGILTLRGRMRS